MSEWYQMALTPPQVIEANLRVGLIPETDHVQFLVELKDPTTSVVIAQWSQPHTTMRQLPHALDLATEKLKMMLEDATEPF